MFFRETSSRVASLALMLWFWQSTPIFTQASHTSPWTSSNASSTQTSVQHSLTCPSKPSVSYTNLSHATKPACWLTVLRSPPTRLHHDHSVGGARRLRHRAAAVLRALAPFLPTQPIPHVAAGAWASDDQCPGPEPSLPLVAQPPPGQSAAAHHTERASRRTHASALVNLWQHRQLWMSRVWINPKEMFNLWNLRLPN